MRRFLLAAALLAAAPALAQAQAVTIEQPWARATTASAKVGGAFMTLKGGAAADRLMSASSPVAGTAEVHQTVNDKGVMKMQPVAELPIEAGKAVELKPGGYHIMLMDLKRPLKAGETFPLTLHFAKAGDITANVVVGAAGAGGAMQGMHQGHMMAPTP